jgi:hypothetical protein
MAKLTATYEYSAAELLSLTNSAIAALIAGSQAYTIAGRSYTAADLDKLRQMRSDLQQEVGAASSGDTYNLAGFSRR